MINIYENKYKYNLIKNNNIKTIKEFINKKYIKIKDFKISNMKTNNIIEKILLYDSCCICYEIPDKNILSSCCYSLFCQICIKKLYSKCPLCKNDFNEILFPDNKYIYDIEKSFDYELYIVIEKYIKNELKNNCINIFYDDNINISNIIKIFRLFLSNVMINKSNNINKKKSNNKKININFFNINYNMIDNKIKNNDNILISNLEKPFIIDLDVKFNKVIILN